MAQRFAVLVLVLLLAACSAGPEDPRGPGDPGEPGEPAYERAGDEMMVAGRLFHTGAPVVLWTDPGGFDAYRVERRFGPWDEAAWEHQQEELETPNRYGLRGKGDWPPETLEAIRGGGWTLDALREQVDQVVIHYDATGTSREAFRVLHDRRGLSAHFLIDVDGTVYQTLDLKERAWHAGPANDRSIGIEIAHHGAHPPGEDAGLHDGRDGRGESVRGRINGRDLVQADFTPEQYASLEKLVAALVRVFPGVRRDYPRGADGRLLTERPLTPAELEAFRGILGHHHVSEAKVDPGPAFQWSRLVRE